MHDYNNSIHLTLKCDSSSHPRKIFIERNLKNENINSVQFFGKWIYDDFKSYSPSYHLAKNLIQSKITFESGSENQNKSILWIEKFKSSTTNKYESEVSALIQVGNDDFKLLSMIAANNHSTLKIKLELEIEYRTEKEKELIKTIEEFNDKNRKITKEYKVNGYQIEAFINSSKSTE